MGNNIELLVVGNCMLRKREPGPALKRDYKNEFELDLRNFSRPRSTLGSASPAPTNSANFSAMNVPEICTMRRAVRSKNAVQAQILKCLALENHGGQRPFWKSLRLLDRSDHFTSDSSAW